MLGDSKLWAEPSRLSYPSPGLPRHLNVSMNLCRMAAPHSTRAAAPRVGGKGAWPVVEEDGRAAAEDLLREAGAPYRPMALAEHDRHFLVVSIRGG
jgi:hypothetical protein